MTDEELLSIEGWPGRCGSHEIRMLCKAIRNARAELADAKRWWGLAQNAAEGALNQRDSARNWARAWRRAAKRRTRSVHVEEKTTVTKRREIMGHSSFGEMAALREALEAAASVLSEDSVREAAECFTQYQKFRECLEKVEGK